ncbi:MAG TPA: M48 family metalloprotease, partial [Fimbriimonas sp.]
TLGTAPTPGPDANDRVERLAALAWSAADEQDAKHAEDLKRDREEGKKYSEQVDKELKASTNAEMNERLQRIAKEITDIANRTRTSVLWGDKRLNTFDYTFKLVEGKDVNAFSLPGGYIYFYEGLVKYTESDDELAGVVAHEIAHASLRHLATLEREQEKVSRIQLPLVLLAILTGGMSAAVNTMQVTGMVGQAIGSGWSVKAEQAADYTGLQYIVQSRYNATGMLTMMERLALDERNGPQIDWGIYQTHPPGRERANSLKRFLKEAQIPVRRSEVTTTFRTTVKPGDDGTVQIFFGDRPIVKLAGEDALLRADDAAKRLNAFFDSTPPLYDVSSDSGDLLGRRQVLFRLTKRDADAAKTDLKALETQALLAIRSSLVRIQFRIWDIK